MDKKDIKGISLIFLFASCCFLGGFAMGMKYTKLQYEDLINEQREEAEKVVEVCNSALLIYRADIVACGCKPSEWYGFTGKAFYYTSGFNISKQDNIR